MQNRHIEVKYEIRFHFEMKQRSKCAWSPTYIQRSVNNGLVYSIKYVIVLTAMNTKQTACI